MATIIVPASGATVSGMVLNDSLQADPSVNLNSIPVFYEVDGASTLRSLYIGYDIELDIGYGGTPASLTGTGTITGGMDATVGNLPLLDNYGLLDINGGIAVNFINDGQTTVSAGERLALTGDLMSLGTMTVAANSELDLDNRTSALITALTVNGTLKSTTANGTLRDTANTGTIDVAAGTLGLATIVTGNGTIKVENGGRLDVASAASVAGTIVLNAGSILRLGQSTDLTAATLQGPAVGAKIDLINMTPSAATVSGGKIVLTTRSATINLAETGLDDGLVLPVTSDGQGGSFITIAAAASTPTPAPVPTPTPVPRPVSVPALASDPAVFRFFDTAHGTQFLTGSSVEADTVKATRPDLKPEGTGFYSVDNKTDANAAPVYRFFDTTYGTHFYTSSADEKATVQATRSDLSYEGIGFYEHATPQAGDAPVHRFFDQNFGTHFYTSNAGERATILATRPDLKPEGTSYYAPTS